MVPLISGIFAIISNNKRYINIIYFFLSILVSLWFELVSRGAVTATQSADSETYFAWHRANAAVAAMLPWALSLLLSATSPKHSTNTIDALAPSLWIALGVILLTLSFFDSFIVPSDGPEPHERGPAYLAYGLIECLSYAFLTILAWLRLRWVKGIWRIDLQALAISLTISGVGVAAAIFRNIIHLPELRAIALFLVLGGFLFFGCSISTQKIYLPLHLLTTISLYVALIFSIYYVFGHLRLRFEQHGGQPLDFILQMLVFLSIIILSSKKIHNIVGLFYERMLVELRKATVQADQAEPNPGKLVSHLEIHLKQSCGASSASLLFERGQAFCGEGVQFDKDSSGFATLCELGWATPEGLERRRRNAGADGLAAFLTEHSLGLLTAVPRGSTRPTLVVALGAKTSGWPFTYPEIQRIQSVGELMDSVVARSRLAMQAAQSARIEHLAMMSRGLAHDLKNLITPISTFLLHSDERYFPSDTPEAQTHAAARRSVGIMTEYVREALFFSERLAPKHETVDVRRVLRDVRAVTEARATSREITLVTESEFSCPIVSDAVLLQRTLVNLVTNAIDASPRGETVQLSARRSTSGGLLLQVVDHGSGISPNHLGQIFDPYFTTKDHGDDVRGFGLGLTICQKIVLVLGGTISADSVVNHGTTMTVELPPASITPR